MSVNVLDSPTPLPAASNPDGATLAEINRSLEKLAQGMESLSVQVQWLTEQASVQQRRRTEWDELVADATPILHEAYRTTVEEMQELEPYVQMDDVVLLAKRLVRNTRNLTTLLDWLESSMDLTHDLNLMGREMMDHATETLQNMEQKGYFGFVRQGQYVLDQIVSSFSEDDVRKLGDNVVLILNTVKALTQPEMMNLVNSLTEGFHEAKTQLEDSSTSLLGLLRQIRDPDVRRGLAVTLAMLKRVSQQSPHRRAA